jgi:hypothetical protein
VVSDDKEAAELYRLAQGNKMVRLGLVRLNEDGEVEPTRAMDDMGDEPIEPDAIDFDAVRRRGGPSGEANE